MDLPSVLTIEGLNNVASLSYDPRTKTFIAGKRGITFVSPGNPSKHIVSKPHLTQNSVFPREFCPPENLCFVPNHKSKNLIISPSGLMVVSKQSSKISEKPILYTNYGFSSGVHYWEIICPLSCNGLNLGVVKIENKKLTVEEMSVFRTTTSRVVGVLLDLEKLKLQFWLNGKEQAGRSKTLTSGYWLPAIRITGIDNCVILNPFTQQPPCINPYDCYNTLKHDFDEWVFIEDDKRINLPDSTEVLEEITVTENESAGLTKLVKVKNPEQFIQMCNKVNITVMNGTNLVKFLAEKSTTKGALKLIKCIQEKEKRMEEKFKTILEGKEEDKTQITNQYSYEEEIERCEYLPHTDSLLLLGKTSLKIISREDEERAGFESMREGVGGFRLNSSPLSLHEVIDFYITRLEAQLLINKLSWIDLARNDPMSDAIPALFEALNKALRSYKDELFVSITYLHAKKAIDCIIQSLLFSSALFESNSTIKNTAMRCVSSPLVRLLSKNKSEHRKTLSFEEVNLLLSIALKLNEQLWCLTSSDSAGESVRSLWDVKTSRLHTTYGRLASFITWPVPGAITLAEAGLYNVGDKRPIIEHFRYTKTVLENVLAFDQTNKKEVWSFLERSFPEDRMLKGEPCANVPLNVTLRHFPALRHKDTEEKPQEIIHLENNGKYVLTGSADGSVNVWNTKLRLVKLLATDFKKKFEVKQEVKGVRSDKKQEKGKDDTFFNTLFDEKSESGSDIELPSEEKPKTEEKKTTVQPNLKLLQQLLSLGFNETLAKKALIQVNNENLDNAMDAILELQKKEPPPKPEEKVKDNYIILSWGCPKCTLINPEGRAYCEVCNESAPQSAYKLKAKEEKKTEVKVEPEVNDNREEEKSLKAKVEEEEAKKLKQAQVRGYSMIYHNEYPSIPFTLACALSDKEQQILKLRRFKYDEKYIHHFILPTINEKAKGYISQISDTWIDNQDYGNAKQQLFKDHRDAVEVYSPLFLRNQLQGSWRFEKTKLAGMHLVMKEEVHIPLDLDEVLDLISIQSNGAHYLVILGKKDSLQLMKMSVSSAYGEESILEVKMEVRVPLPNRSDIGRLLYNGKDFIVVVTQEGCLIVNTKDLFIQRDILQTNTIHNVFLISEDDTKEEIIKNTLIFAEKNCLKKFHLVPKSSTEIEEVKKIEEEELKPVKTDFPEIEAESLTIEDLTSYVMQMKSKRIGCKAKPTPGTILLSSKKDETSGYCSKHNWDVCENNGKSQEFLLELQNKTTVNHLLVSLTFTQGKVTVTKPEEDVKIDKTDKGQVKEISAKDLGLLSVRGSGDISTEGKKFHIPLVIATHKGAQYSFQNTVSRMLVDNNTTFASNYPRPHFIFKHQFGKRLLVDKVISDVNH